MTSSGMKILKSQKLRNTVKDYGNLDCLIDIDLDSINKNIFLDTNLVLKVFQSESYTKK